MVGKIYIGGEVTHDQIDDAQSWGLTNLISVNKQIDSQPDAKSFEVTFNTIGGSITEGFAIYQRLREVSASGAPITTKIKGNLASIGTVMFLAGDKRIVNEFFEPFVHEAQGGVGGSNSDIQDYAKIMNNANEKVIGHYDKHLKISREEIVQMMKDETYITPERAIEIGFATETEEILRPAAKLNIVNNYKNDKMKKEDLTKDEQSLLGKFADFLGMSTKKEEIKNILVKTATQEELNFFEREEGLPEVGDKVQYSGDDESIKNAVENGGEVLMASEETYVFEAGALADVKPKEAEQEEGEDLQAVIDDLKQQLEAKNLEFDNKNTELQAKENEFTGLEEKYNSLEAKHTGIMSKINDFKSKDSVNTANKNPKKEPKAKITFAERMEAKANNK